MNMISNLRRRISATGKTVITTEEFNQLQEEWVKRVDAELIKSLWKTQNGECPDGNLLIEVDLSNGDSDIALVFIGENERTLYFADDNEDIYSAWVWSDVSRYCLLSDIIPAR